MDERLSIAPMMEWTDPHYRALLRSLTKKTVLYTEMVVDDTILHTDTSQHDFFIGPNRGPRNEDYGVYPSVIQLGGSNPATLAEAAARVEQYGHGYGEINLNCGCPSQRVAKKCFGAKLMLNPDLVREIVSTMQRRVQIPITVKCRIGADEKDSYEELVHFIKSARDGGARKFIIHRYCAGKAQ
jgi:tRNA-dihydrouridine synthase A